MKKRYLFLVLVIVLSLILFNSYQTTAYMPSNESTQTYEKLLVARDAIKEMQDRNITLVRVNESYQEALQLYEAQKALERLGRNADYSTILEYVDDILEVRDNSFKAFDELRIFLDFYKEYSETINLSAMDTEYNAILFSFEQERFEDTLVLIDEGYEVLSEVQSSQTTLNLFYETTSKTLKNFLKNNWRIITTSIIVIFILFFIFSKTLSKIKAARKLRHLNFEKQVLYKLIKKIQKDYFEKGKISELEFHTRLKKFEEMIRDINRQVPLVKEKIMKLNKRKVTQQIKIERKQEDKKLKQTIEPLEIKSKKKKQIEKNVVQKKQIEKVKMVKNKTKKKFVKKKSISKKKLVKKKSKKPIKKNKKSVSRK